MRSVDIAQKLILMQEERTNWQLCLKAVPNMRFKVTINAKQLVRPLSFVGARQVELNEVPGGRNGSVGRVVLIATSAGGASLASLSPEYIYIYIYV